MTVLPKEPFLVVPEVSSSRREYIPMAWLEPPIVPSNKIRIITPVAKWQFALLSSAMHMAWVRNIGGRLKSDYQYSIGIDYNPFPLPTTKRFLTLEPFAQAILDARSTHPNATLAQLYDPDLMPDKLRKAHTALNRAVDRLYQKKGFTSERERIEHLFLLYERMVAPIEAAANEKIRPRRRQRVERERGSA